MPMPPENVDKSELFLRLASREPPNELVDYPDDSGEKIRLKGLDSEDLEPIVIRARQKLKEDQKLSESDLEAKFWDIRLQDRTARAILSETVLRPKPIEGSEHTEKGTQYPRVFYTPEQVGKLPPREIAILWALWNLVQNRISPTETMLSEPEQVRAWVEVLTEGARPFGFFQLELPQQEVLLSSLLQWAKLLLSLLSSLPEPLPSNWESLLTSYGFDTGWCSALAANSTLSQASEATTAQADEPLTAEEAEAIARERLKLARKMADDDRE